MKKKYIQPTTKLHSVSTSRMVATSDLDYNSASGTNGNVDSGANDSKDDLDFGW